MQTEEAIGGTQPRALLSLAFSRTYSSDPARGPVMRVLRQDPPWRVVRSFPLDAESCLVHLHNLSGGVLSGDKLLLLVDVGENARVQLTSTGATRVYRRRQDRGGARCITRAVIGRSALLEYLPDQIIPYKDSQFHQDTEVELDAENAGLFWWETITAGRTASGERFAFDTLELRTRLTCEGKLFALDQFAIKPTIDSPARVGMIGTCDCWSTFYICKTGVENRRWAELEEMLNEEAERLSSLEMHWGASRLMEHGIMIRGAGLHAAHMLTALVSFWRIAKLYLYERIAVMPRKVH